MDVHFSIFTCSACERGIRPPGQEVGHKSSGDLPNGFVRKCPCLSAAVGMEKEVAGCQTGGLQMPVRLRVARSLPLTEYPFRVNELGQSLHVRLQLGLALGRSKRSVLFTWRCHANEPTHA